MVGSKPAGASNNTIPVPHLVGMKGGPNPYWAKYDWNLALQDGAAYTGQTYFGEYHFVDTVMYLTVNHEVAPKEQAYGMDGACGDCHGDSRIDGTELGWTDDPIFPGSTRPKAPQQRLVPIAPAGNRGRSFFEEAPAPPFQSSRRDGALQVWLQAFSLHAA